MSTQKYTAQNMGLPTRFKLTNGKFTLIGGTDKVDDNLSMLLAFIGWYRLYSPDFIIGVYEFFQNTTNYLIRYKSILRKKVIDTCATHAPNANVYAVDVLQTDTRKDVTIFLQYQYNLQETDESLQLIKKVIE